MRPAKICLFLFLIFMFSAGVHAAPADEKASQKASSPEENAKTRNLKTGVGRVSTTEHVLEVNGEKLAYTAQAGEMIVDLDNNGKKARFFFIAYKKNGRKQNERPITFAFNGGPGAAAVWLHLGGLGPRILDLDETGTPLPPPVQMIPNPLTWLRFTDMVFIDPVGTGYSRSITGKEKQFFNLQEDVRSVAEFIRLYLSIEDRWLSPKFLTGESYGTTRAAALSEYLDRSLGIRLNGIVLISPVLDFATITFDGSLNLPYSLFLPSYAAAKKFHEQGL
ncbi:MAG: S10 family serine carboxypeptidase-like protein, partial [Desulfovibrionales bacterium]